MIYLISNEFRSALKIGYADTLRGVKRRKHYFQCGNVDKLAIVAVIDGTQQEERRMHRYFRKYHRRGEWFHDVEEIRAHFASQMNFYEPTRQRNERRRMTKEQRKLRRMQLDHQRVLASEERERARAELAEQRRLERVERRRAKKLLRPPSNRPQRAIQRSTMVVVSEKKSDCATRAAEQLESMLLQFAALGLPISRAESAVDQPKITAELPTEQKVMPQDCRGTAPASTIDPEYPQPISAG